MKIFGMVTTAGSSEYTNYAIRSFFRHTTLDSDDTFYLIDNDGSYVPERGAVDGTDGLPISIINNPEPKSFAANVNQIFDIAAPLRADIYFLNNDLIFTENWLSPLAADNGGIRSPLSNREVQYEVDGFLWKNSLQLSDYVGREESIAELVRQHRARMQGMKQVISLPFFCVKIPFSVYTVVGKLDERFGRGGAEDDDYSVRAYLAGFDVAYAAQSFVLHFSGKSTWSGAESASETEARCAKFRAEFTDKWGVALRRMLIDHDLHVLESSPELIELGRSGDTAGIVKHLARMRS